MLRFFCHGTFRLVVLLCFSFSGLFAQSQQGAFWESEGTIPDDFLVSWSEKLASSLESNSSNKDNLEDFWLDQHHSIDAFLQSGRYSFGDPITKYLNEITDHLLRHDPELRAKIRVYAYRSPSVNGFTLADGIIAIHMGLLAHVKSEAELAFVLAHEIAHYEREHFYERFQLLNQQNNDGWFSGNSMSPLAQAERLISRSKEHEIDADLSGLELYLKSDYSLEAVDTLLTTLNYSHLPFGRAAIMGNPFCVPQDCYSIPEVYYRKKIDPISKEENYADARHLHPNIGERRSQIHSALVQREVKPGQRFILGEERFNSLQEQARFESIREKVRIGDYTGALYDIYILQNSYPNNKFLTLSRVKALYGLASYKALDKISAVLPSTANIQGPYEQIVHLVKQMNRSQLVSIALQASFTAQDLYPEEAWLKRYSSQLSKYLVVYCGEEPDEFMAEGDGLAPFTKTEADFRSPRAFIRAQQGHYRDFYRYLITNQERAQWLKKEMTAYIPYRDSIREWRQKPAGEIADYWEARRDRLEEEGSGLNIREMIILDPVIKVLNVGEDREERLEALKQEQEFKQRIEQWTSEMGLKTHNLYMEDFNEYDVAEYNRFCQLEEWVAEARFFHRHRLMPVSIDMPPALKNGPRYVCRIIGVINLDGGNTYFFGVFDLKKGKLVYAHYYEIGGNMRMKDLMTETKYALDIIYN